MEMGGGVEIDNKGVHRKSQPRLWPRGEILPVDSSHRNSLSPPLFVLLHSFSSRYFSPTFVLIPYF